MKSLHQEGYGIGACKFERARKKVQYAPADIHSLLSFPIPHLTRSPAADINEVLFLARATSTSFSGGDAPVTKYYQARRLMLA
jgi:hypothetical protein